MTRCTHKQTRTLYIRGPKAEGSNFLPNALRCLDCQALLEKRPAKPPLA